jgi:hypothetical protein
MVLTTKGFPSIFAKNHHTMRRHIFTTIIAATVLFASCKKDDNNNSNPTSSNIPAGQATISFNTDKDFGGTTSINIPPSVSTTSVRVNNGTRDQIALTAVQYQGSAISSAMLTVYVDAGASTSAGNITANFNASGNANPAVLLISNTSVSGQSTAYTSETGTVTITKLSATEVEGTFSCNAVNESTNANIGVTNGKFAAKFK